MQCGRKRRTKQKSDKFPAAGNFAGNISPWVAVSVRRAANARGPLPPRRGVRPMGAQKLREFSDHARNTAPLHAESQGIFAPCTKQQPSAVRSQGILGAIARCFRGAACPPSPCPPSLKFRRIARGENTPPRNSSSRFARRRISTLPQGEGGWSCTISGNFRLMYAAAAHCMRNSQGIFRASGRRAYVSRRRVRASYRQTGIRGAMPLVREWKME
jgi:hypothetical protein